MPSRKQILVGVAAGLVVGGAVAYTLSKKKGECNTEDDVEFEAPKKAPASVAPPKPSTAAATLPEQSPMTASSAQFTKEYSFNVNDDNEKMLEEALAEQDAETKQHRPVVANKEDGSVAFAHLGVSMIPPAGWTVREELSPMPNVAMITITKPEFAEQQMNPEDMGSVPVIILSVEDIAAENLDLIEFKEKSKQMALTQMLMMTNGMVQPVMKFDDAMTVGPFRHCLEYGQSLPPYFDIAVSNLLAVENGLAYVFQIMCNPKVMSSFKPLFMEMARNVKIGASTTGSIGHITLETGRGVSINVPTTWGWTSPSRTGVFAEFTTPSTVKSESITLYDNATAPKPSASAKTTEKVLDGVTIATVREGRNEIKEFRFNGFTAVVKPLQKPNVQINELHVVAAVRSVKASDVSEEKAVFLNKEHGYCVDIAKGGKLIATCVGGGTVVYAPLGVPSDPNRPVDPEEQGPTVTIRVGSPENDPDCADNLEGWEERMEAEKSSGNITNLQRVSRNGFPCLTFISKDMQEVGPGQKMEVQGKVFIFVRNGKTTLVRWETATGLWRKFEPKMERFIDSLKFI